MIQGKKNKQNKQKQNKTEEKQKKQNKKSKERNVRQYTDWGKNMAIEGHTGWRRTICDARQEAGDENKRARNNHYVSYCDRVENWLLAIEGHFIDLKRKKKAYSE